MHRNKLVSTFYARSPFQFATKKLRAFLFRQSNKRRANQYTYATNEVSSFFSALCPQTLGRILLLFALLLLLNTHSVFTAHASLQVKATHQSTVAQADSEQGQTATAPDPAPLAKSAQTADEYVPGEVIVVFRNDLTRSAQLHANNMVQGISLDVAEELDLSGFEQFLGNQESSDGLATQSGYRSGQILRVPDGREAEVIAQLRENPDVVFAIRNQIVRAAGVPSGFMHESASTFQTDWYGQLASAEQTSIDAQMVDEEFEVNDPYYANQWYMNRIEMLEAWALTLGTNDEPAQMNSVKVAIVDSGIDHLHPELSGRILEGKNYFAPSSLPIDNYGHGTHVAGLIAASVNNGIGIAGVAPWVEILPYKVLDGAGEGTISNVAKAIRDATDVGADIINLSLETGEPDLLMEAAIEYAASQDILLIASVGNLAPRPVRWPAADSNVIGVAATNETDQHAAYSCTGPQVEIAAPGGTISMPIQSTWSSFAECPGNDDIDPEIGAYCYARGTSMSTGIVSGVAALLYGINDDLSAEEAREILIDTAIPLLSQEPTEIGNGLVNANDATRQTVPTQLQVSAESNIAVIEEGAAPYDVIITVQNPSLHAVEWEAGWQDKSWLAATSDTAGSVQFGVIDTVEFTVTPAELTPRFYNTIVTITGTQSNGTQIIERVPINVEVKEAPASRPTLQPTPRPAQPPDNDTGTSGQNTPPQLAFTMSYGVTDLVLKRSDEPYALQLIMSNNESSALSWELTVAPAAPNTSKNWLDRDEVQSGVLSPSTATRITILIDPITLDVGNYASLLTINATEQSTARAKEVTAQLSVQVTEGEFRAMLPTMRR